MEASISGFIKVNCDGSLKANGKGGVGGICRAEDGGVLGVFCAPVSLCQSAKDVEAQAIREAMCFARDYGFRKIIIETDASEIVKEILCYQPSCSLHGDIIQEIWNLKPLFDDSSFCYVPRQYNSVADRLASIGVIESQPLY